MEDTTELDPREVDAASHNLNYVQLDGNIGCLVFIHIHAYRLKIQDKSLHCVFSTWRLQNLCISGEWCWACNGNDGHHQAVRRQTCKLP